MRSTLLPATLLAVLSFTSLTACNRNSGSILDPSAPELPEPELPEGGAGDGAIVGGTWTSPDDSNTIELIDSSSYTPTGMGTGATSGTSTALVFQTSGSALYGVGTCGAEGTWTSADGSVRSHSPNCLAYFSHNETGDNGKGQCVRSPEGYAGLWMNPQMHATSPYHPNCLQLGATTTSLALSFPGQAEHYEANDGSAGRILNFTSGGVTRAQLIYHGDADGTSTGAGVLVGTDGADQLWTVDFSQPALNYTGGQANGDLVTQLIGPGLQVVACNTAVGCSLVSLGVTLTQ